jgi:hypothetical protein
VQTESQTSMSKDSIGKELLNALQSIFVAAYDSWHSPENCATDLSEACNAAWYAFVGALWQSSCEHGKTYEKLKGPIGDLYVRYQSLVNEWITTAKVISYIRRDLLNPDSDNREHALQSDLQKLLPIIQNAIEHSAQKTREQDTLAGQTVDSQY